MLNIQFSRSWELAQHLWVMQDDVASVLTLMSSHIQATFKGPCLEQILTRNTTIQAKTKDFSPLKLKNLYLQVK